MIIGIIGGGQLGMMMAEASAKYDVKIIGLDPNVDCPLSYHADEMIISEYNDESAFAKLVEKSDVITYEFENVDLSLVDKYSSHIPQKSSGLRNSRNRLTEKEYANSLDIKTAKFLKLNSIDDVFTPSIIKTTTGGYDGKGQHLISEKNDIDQLSLNDDIEYIVEELVKFDFEISVVASRDAFGNVVTYPIPKNTHRNGILFTSEVFNDLSPKIVTQAIEYTNRIIDDLDYIGTLAIEYFIKGDEVIFNEFAPRPHNSGHYTIEGCNVSQFENHIRAIMGMEVLVPTLSNPTIMINVLGQDDAFVKRASADNAFVHMYNKKVSNFNRKMGHITIMNKSQNQLTKTKNYIIGE